MENPKFFLSSKTIWWNLLGFVLAVAAFIAPQFPVPADWSLFVQAVGNVILRFVTTKPISL